MIEGFDNNWNDINGKSISLSGENGTVSAYNEVPMDYNDDDFLCFRSKNSDIFVYLNGEEIYRYDTTVNSIFGESSGSCWHTVKLPIDAAGKTIMIKSVPKYNEKNSFVSDLMIGSSGEYILYILKSKLLAFLMCIILLVAGIFLLFFDIPFRQFNEAKETHAFAYLVLIVILVAIWCSTETQIFQLILGKTAWVHLLNYFSLMLLPFPAYVFISKMFGINNIIVNNTVLALTFVNCILRIVLNNAGIMDYHNSLVITLVLLAFILLTLFVSIIMRQRQLKKVNKALLYIYIALGTIFISALIDMVRYITISTDDTAYFLRLGMIFSVVFLGLFVISNVATAFRSSYETEVMEKIAYTDILTNINNRAAYVKYMDSLENNMDRYDSIAFIQYDINDLKHVNDTYGHVAGDEYIVRGSRFISESIGNSGRVFRTGGDEFVAVIASDNAVKKCEESLKRLEKIIIEYNINNPGSTMHIASGFAYYNKGEQTKLYDVVKVADKHMYDKKRLMKS